MRYDLFFSKKSKEKLFILAMVALPILSFLLFWVAVSFNSIFMAFTTPQKNGITLKNFRILFNDFSSSTSMLSVSVKNTLITFAVGLLIVFPLTIFISYFIYKKIFLSKFFRMIFFMPAIISAVIMTTIFKYIIGPTGPIIEIIKLFGFSDPPLFLAESKYALVTTLFFTVWTGFSGNIILLGGAMGRIPDSVLEAARLDGVGPLKELVSIILPMIWPTISTLILLSFAGMFTASGPVLLLTNGQFNTSTLAFWFYARVSYDNVFEYAAAVGLFFTCISFPLALIVRRITSKINTGVEY